MPAPFVRFHRNYLLCGDTAIVPPAVFCTAVCRGGRLCLPACPVSPDFLFCSDTATVAPRACFFCCARKSRQKESLGDAPYCALPRAIFLPLRGLNALFWRRIATIPIASGSAECTTRSYGQTASISVLLISGILGQSHSRTAYCRGGRLCPPCLSFTYVCRGRWRAQPSAT